MANLTVPYLNVAETGSVCSDRDSGIGSCSPTSTGPACIPEHKSVQTFRSTEDYLYAMKEDLAEWLNCLYDHDMCVENFFEKLDDGVLLCEHASHVQMLAEEYRDDDSTASDYFSEDKIIPRKDLKKAKIPDKGPVYRKNVKKQSFQARDNIANFISWCKCLGIPDVVLFETEDLVGRKNVKSVVLAMLEVARRGARFGMLVPCLIQLEQEIDAEIKGEPPPPPPPQKMVDDTPKVQRITCDMKSLDEMVRELVSQCTCMPEQFPVIRISEGKYMVGENKTLIFVRILRNHVMVRVGGGWDTLEHYLNKHDPCRCGAKSGRRTSVSGQSQHGNSARSTPVRQTIPEHRVPTRDLVTSASASPRSSIDGSIRDVSGAPGSASAPSAPATPTQTRRTSMTRDGSQSPALARRSITPSKQRSVSLVQRPPAAVTRTQSPQTASTTGSAGSSTNNNASSSTAIPASRRKLSLDNIPSRTSSKDRSERSQRSPTTPERVNGLQSLEGTLSAIRQQSELLQKQLQDDFSDDSSICSVTSPVERKGSTPMSKSLDFSRLRGERRASAPPQDLAKRKDSTSGSRRDTAEGRTRRDSANSSNSSHHTNSLPRRSQTPNSQRSSGGPSQPDQIIQRRSKTPQPATTSRTRSQPTTPVMRRRDVAKTPERSLGEPTNRYNQRAITPNNNMNSTLKERLTKYKQETSTPPTTVNAPRVRRNSEATSGPVQQPSNLAASRRKSPSMSALDRKGLEPDLDSIEDVGGDEELYSQMEKMFQEFKEQERAKAEQEEARASVEAELERRMRDQELANDPRAKQESARETLRERLRHRSASTTPTLTRKSEQQRRNSSNNAPPLTARTAPNTPSTPRRSASAAPSWRDNSNDIVRRGSRSISSTRRCKTPDPPTKLALATYDEPDYVTNGAKPAFTNQNVKMCKCCHLLSECLSECKVEPKPRKDNDFTRPATRIPGPKTLMTSSKSMGEVRRATSLVSLSSNDCLTDCESICSDDSKSADNEIKSITKGDEVFSLPRRMSAPNGDSNRMMSALVTNRSTIMKEVPRAVSPVKAMRLNSIDS